MNYEMAVLAALVQLDKPTRPKITEETGISAQRVNTAINHLKDMLDIGIHWQGARRTGYYQIVSWGSFETGKHIRHKAYSLNLAAFKNHKEIEYDPIAHRKHYAKNMKLHNYRQSLKLEGFSAREPSLNLAKLSPSERSKRRDELKKKYTKPTLTISR